MYVDVSDIYSLSLGGGSKDEEDVADDQDHEGDDGAPPEPGVVGQVLRQTQELLIRSEHRRSCHLCVLPHGGAPDVPELGEADGVAAVLVPGRHLRLPLSLVPAVCCYFTTLTVGVGCW